MVDHVVAGGPAWVLDVATGTAGVAIQIADRTGACVTGVDLMTPCSPRSDNGPQEGFAGTDRARRRPGRAAPLPRWTFAAPTFTYLLRYVADPAATLAELARAVAPGAPLPPSSSTSRPSCWRVAWWLYTRRS